MSKNLKLLGEKAISNILYLLLKEIEFATEDYDTIPYSENHVINREYLSVLIDCTFLNTNIEYTKELKDFLIKELTTELEEGTYIDNSNPDTLSFKKKFELVFNKLEYTNTDIYDIFSEAIDIVQAQ